MRYIVITFDDGRRDNFTTALPIMQKYGLYGTVFVTTGFIDGSWNKDESWLSAGEALNIDELKFLKYSNWEIALHGDRHTTDIDDMEVSMQKINSWLGTSNRFGFSVPNSNASSEKIKEIEEVCLNGGRVAYIRRGRGRNTHSLGSKLLFALYTLFKLQWAYNRFNAVSINNMACIDKTNLKSVVIRSEDDPKMVSRFIEQTPDNSLIVLMLHSIIEKDAPLYNADPWCWDSDYFTSLCADIRKFIDNRMVAITTLERLFVHDKV